MAVISLIVTPLVLNIIRRVNDSANKRSVDAYGRAVELAIAGYLLEKGNYPNTLDDLKVEYSGNEVICNVRILNDDDSIYLSECRVAGREVRDTNTEDGWYHYGKKKLTNEEYVDMYGKALEDAISEYISLNNSLPSDYKALNISYDAKLVKCDVTINSDGSIFLTKCSVENIIVKDSSTNDGYYHYGKIKYKSLVSGSSIYYNPETNQICLETEAISTSGTKTGCMKWYTFNDNEDEATVNLILDHNTTPLVAWNSNDVNTQMLEVKKALDEDSATWNDEVKDSVRLIGADEIAKITGNTKFDLLTSNGGDWFYFNTNTSTNDSSTSRTYAWLFDNLYECTNYGCKVDDNNTYNRYNSTSTGNIYGYWTNSSVASSNFIWYINRVGSLDSTNAASDYNIGIRPVIEISKSILNK